MALNLPSSWAVVAHAFIPRGRGRQISVNSRPAWSIRARSRNLRFFFLCFSGIRITGVFHCTWFMWFWESNLVLMHARQALLQLSYTCILTCLSVYGYSSLKVLNLECAFLIPPGTACDTMVGADLDLVGSVPGRDLIRSSLCGWSQS